MQQKRKMNRFATVANAEVKSKTDEEVSSSEVESSSSKDEESGSSSS
jgi:hypothetical protein